MDPDKALRQLRLVAAGVAVPDHPGQTEETPAVYLARRFLILDNWITHGGFLPYDWTHTANNHQ